MVYEFQDTIFSNRKDLCEAIAGAWISANGMNDRAAIERIIAESSAESLVRECIDGYGFDDDWLSDRGIDEMYIFTGFLSVMESPAEAFGWNAEGN